jgi:hypothetical protein
MVREGDAFAIYFEGGDVPPFRARGVAGDVLRLAEEHLRALAR